MIFHRHTVDPRVAYRYSQQTQNFKLVIDVVSFQFPGAKMHLSWFAVRAGHTPLAMGNRSQIPMPAKTFSKPKMC